MIKREKYLERIRPVMNSDLVKVLTGIRRSGKSVMLQLIQEELIDQGISLSQFITINFESISTYHFHNATALYEELKNRISSINGRSYLFLDEIQEVQDWEKCINSCRVDFDCDIYITGSNAKLLSGELATYLGGRYVEFVIYPFSFSEYIESRKQITEHFDLNDEFKRYLELGGMPFLTNIPNDKDASKQYLKDLYNSVVLKDIVTHNHIRDVDLLERIISYLIANIGHTVSARSISNYLKSEKRKIAPETVLNYIKFCCDAYLFYKINREDIPSKKILSINEKYYIADHGIRESIFGNNQRDIECTLENIVCLELIRRGYSLNVGKFGDKEIDFMAKKSGNTVYVQVSYLLASEETIQREFSVLSKINNNYPKYIISMDEVDLSRDGIIHKNIKDFLLQDL